MTATSTTFLQAGLLSREGQAPVALERVVVAAHATGLAATVTLTQHFCNTEKVPLEVVYVFPLDEGAAVRAFEAVVDGVRYVGEVKEREAAFRDYDDAMEAGHGAFLLDEERPDVFTASLGNLKPGSRGVLTLTYVTELATEGMAARFTLPTTVSPRYAPAEDHVGIGRTEAEALNPPVAPDVPYRFTFEMRIDATGAISRIDSPSHPISVEQDGPHAMVRLAQRDAAMDRDLVIVVAAVGLSEPQAIVERHPHGEAAMLTFVPQLPKSASPAEVVFLIDRSGSMQGSSIAEVRNALQLCLRSLTEGCRFNIVSFGSRFESLFEESRPYDETSLAAGSALVAGLAANMGGTEIASALDFVLTRPSLPGLPRQVVLLTDGEVTNTDAVVALARRHAGTARVFTFGIGAGASVHLVRAVARASGGAAEFIAPGERVEAKVLRQLGRLLAPALLDVKVVWPGQGIVQAPQVPPAVFGGERLVVYGLATSMPAGTVTLTGTLAGEPFRTEVNLAPQSATEGLTIGSLWARARIRDLEEHPDFFSARGSQQRRPRDTRDPAAEIAALGVRFQLCSRETSFVAIEHREVPTTEQAQLRRIPIMLTNGWGGIDQRALSNAPNLLCAAPPDMRARQTPGTAAMSGGWMSESVAMVEAPATRRVANACARGHREKRHELLAPLRGRHPVPRVVSPGAAAHDEVIRLQRADGSWELTDELLRLVDLIRPNVERLLSGMGDGDSDAGRRALATALVLAWLPRHAGAYTDEWRMIAEKAERWLATQATPPGGTPWREAVARL